MNLLLVPIHYIFQIFIQVHLYSMYFYLPSFSQHYFEVHPFHNIDQQSIPFFFLMATPVAYGLATRRCSVHVGTLDGHEL